MAIIRRKESESSTPTRREWDPYAAMQALIGLDPFAQLTGLGGESMTRFNPSFDVKETKDAYHFKADLPGMGERDLDISLTANRLTISGRREEEKRDENDRFFAYERSYGSFTRSFTLPEGIDSEHVQADMKDGVLSVVVPKKPEVQPRRIQIKAGAKDASPEKVKA